MLINFSVGNYRSFKDVVTLSMVAARITSKNKQIDTENVFQVGNVSLLKSASIYGANASGKSNLFRAFRFMRWFVLRSTDANSEDLIKAEPFLLSAETEQAPSFFEVIFVQDGIRYRYGFEVSVNKVHAEWLFRTVKRETELFWREDDNIAIKEGFKEGKGLEDRTRSNALFLSVVDQWNGETAGKIVSWFRKVGIISGLDDRAYLGFTVNQMVDQTPIALKIQDFMRRMDFGILNVLAEKRNSNPKFLSMLLDQIDNVPDDLRNALSNDEWFVPVVKTKHQKYAESGQKTALVEFDMDDHESEGTKKAFALSGPLLHTLQDGRVLFVDELDARLHPKMTREIIRLFNSNDTNPKNAQLIFATHDANLLDNRFFRRDQIWFTEKNRYGATDLYSLVEYKIRNDASFEADYIAGKYGAIPYIRNIKSLVGGGDE